MALAALLLPLIALFAPPPQAAQAFTQNPATVWINEFHYDNASTDTDEFIEVAGPAGTDLTGWSIVLYNGTSSQRSPYDTLALSGTLNDDTGTGFGFQTVFQSGIQNGAPDGFALVDNNGIVVQFLSYEGSFTAASGEAASLTSTDVGVSEPSSTPVGQSLQLSGTGSTYQDFTWQSPATATPGAANNGQTFTGGPGDTAPAVSSSTPANNGTVLPAANLSVTFSEPVTVTGNWAEVVCSTSGTQSVGGGTLSVTDSDPTFTLDPATDFTVGESCTLTIVAAQVADDDGDDPPDTLAADVTIDFTVDGPRPFPLTDDFTSCALAGWQIVSVDADTANTWSCGSGYLEANGFGDSVPADEWLITPSFDMDAQSGEVLSFSTWTRYSDSVYPPLEVVYSTNYDGGGDPTTATWTALSGITFSPQDSQVWTPSGTINLASISGSSVYFAFHYTSTGTSGGSAAQWRVDDVSFTTVAEAAPAVSSSTPANNGTVLPAANLSVTFSEPVTVTGNWAEVVCSTSGTQSVGGGTLSVTDSDPTFTLDPATDFTVGESCTLTIVAAQVADDDGDDPPDTLAANVTIDFTVAAACVASDTLISAVQGNGNAGNGTAGSTTYTVEGVVTGVYPGTEGFYLQEEDADADGDPTTSEGIFIFTDSVPTVSEGDVVQVTGTFDEFFDETQLDTITNIETCDTGQGGLVTPIDVTLPVPADVGGVPFLERYEGMLVNFTQDLIVSETFNLGRGGLLRLSANNRLYQPTQLETPGAASDAIAATNARNQIVLDDGTTAENPDPVIYPTGGLSAANTVRGGDTVSGVAGVLAYKWHGYSLSGNPTNAYRVYPTSSTNVSFAATNPRQATPDPVGGSLKVASFNVLNYFTTTGSGNNCGPASNQECRGADNATEFERQHDKIVAALAAMDADIIGLIELENSNNNIPLNVLVNGGTVGSVTVTGLDTLSARDYEFVATGAIGTDAIRQGFIYDANTVSLSSVFAVLDTQAFVDPFNAGPKNRPALAQTFTEIATGGEVTVVVNHFKSKGSGCGAGDDDSRQGNCNATRDAAAQELADWLATNPTSASTNNIMIIGDLNAYAKEDPLVTLQTAGYTDLAATFVGARAYSFVFDGNNGTLDYALANGDLLPRVTGVTEWHINTDEPRALDYDLNFKSTGQQTSFYKDDAFRSSDHDPVIVGLTLGTTIVVESIADDSSGNLDGNGTCDLREAIFASNNDTVVGECAAGSSIGTDYIHFDIPGNGPHIIDLQINLPAVDGANPLVIDGVTEPDASCTNGVPNPSVVVRDPGNFVGTHIELLSLNQDVTVRGLSFDDFLLFGIDAAGPVGTAGGTVTVECNTFASIGTFAADIAVRVGTTMNAVVRGNTFANPTKGIVYAGGAGTTLDAYANNFNGYGGDGDTQVAIQIDSDDGAENIRYNFYDDCTDPTDCFAGAGLTPAERDEAWQFRLGAGVQGWSMGEGGTSLDTPDGPALLDTVGGDGMAVIVNHGTGTSSANAPFGAFDGSFGSDRCTNYYDFFVMDSGGADSDNWQIELPLYSGSGCDTADSLSLFDLNRDVPNHAAACPGGGFWCYWVDVAGTVNSQNPNPALQATLPESSLLGTPLVGGNAANQDPTSVALVGFVATPGSNQLAALLPVLAGLLLLAGTALLVARRRG